MMDVVEAAKRLERVDPSTDDNSCFACGAWVAKHSDGCPWLAMPRIVKALEDIKRLATEGDDAAYEGDVKIMSRTPSYILAALEGR